MTDDKHLSRDAYLAGYMAARDRSSLDGITHRTATERFERWWQREHE